MEDVRKDTRDLLIILIIFMFIWPFDFYVAVSLPVRILSIIVFILLIIGFAYYTVKYIRITRALTQLQK
ncbi:MAG: hypothetical protein ACXABN_18350 [Candidatus Thorarchaeota archaeon]